MKLNINIYQLPSSGVNWLHHIKHFNFEVQIKEHLLRIVEYEPIYKILLSNQGWNDMLSLLATRDLRIDNNMEERVESGKII